MPLTPIRTGSRRHASDFLGWLHPPICHLQGMSVPVPAGSYPNRRARDYLSMAASYGAAAKVVSEHAPESQAIVRPLFQLIAHALELSLKAALSHQGRDEEWLMMMGHSLERCYAQAIRGGLYSVRDRSMDMLIEALDRPHALQLFRYPQSSSWTAPDRNTAIQAMAGHLGLVGSYIYDPVQDDCC
jgi:hypothetical protein